MTKYEKWRGDESNEKMKKWLSMRWEYEERWMNKRGKWLSVEMYGDGRWEKWLSEEST